MKADEVERRFDAGECILEAGSHSRELYVIRSGSVRLIPEAEAPGKLLGPGEIFGELPAILGTSSAWRALAVEETTLLALDPPLLNRLCLDCPEFSMRLIQHLADELAHPVTVRASPSGPALGPEERTALEAFAGAVLDAAQDPGSGPAPVTGGLRELSSHARVSIRDAYVALHLLLDKRWLRLSEDQLSVVDREQLEALIRG
ncbi:MAG: Crp/Fnr family transcriptional regulator [Myxococcota bacterium]